MRRKALGGAVALIAAVNGIVLAGAAWNRSGTPEATLALTERELPESWRRASNENSGIALALRFQHLPEYPWLDRAKLQSLGFDLAEHATDAERYKDPLSRRGYVVLEFDGAAWSNLLQEKEQALVEMPARIQAGEATEQQQKFAQDSLERMRTEESRLVPVDAGPDAGALRARFPDPERYLIAPARFDVRRYYRHAAGAAPAEGYLRGILVDTIHLPADLHPALAEAKRQGSPQPRYRVTLHYGRRHEPWIGELVPVRE